MALRYLAGESMSLPDQGRGWIMRAAGAARALMKRHRFDLVISSGPPHSAHFAGMLATLSNGVPHWIDMRDPWSDPFRPGTPRRRSARLMLAARLEPIIFRHIKRVIVNTSEFARVLRAREPQLDIIYMPNGINTAQLPERTDERFAECSIAYVGALYANRNLTTVLAAVAEIARERPEVAGLLKLRIAGPMAPAHRQQFERDLAEHGLSNMVEVLGVLSRTDALALLNRSHLALVLAQNQPMAVPAKLYETVGMRVPTLVIAEGDSASAREARRIGTLIAEPQDIRGMRAIFEDALAGRLPASMEPKVPIDYDDLSKVMNRVLRGDRRTERDDSRPVGEERRRRNGS
jgi:glycosyltransferase involved in cell wall biosynthesis